ncbi:putative quinol monooxygenase [Flexibacterium corallicola]|uniref:putative quinol monooxygenase n=1 Tax=Flexibacterium corallicola TaxID=3037259 RepID=UPI00286EF2D8|nr:antibiotic biosynthesis monooxygenase [Pseudovibrio sp. M1P-2-3]
MSGEPFVVVVKMYLKEGQEQNFYSAIKPVLDRMRLEKEFINTSMLHAQDDPRSIMLFETWRGLEYFEQVQLHRPYFTSYFKKLQSFLEKPLTREYFSPVRSDYAFHESKSGQLL